MDEEILVDTGPIVAILSRTDPHHTRCFECVRDRKGPLFTCWPVLTEAAWLLRARPKAVNHLLRGLDEGLFRVLELDQRAPSWIAGFLEQYSSLPAQLADAALVYLAEQRRIDTVLTLDRRDFSVYRLADGRVLRIVPEF